MFTSCRLFLSACLIATAWQLATPPAAAQAVKVSQFSGKPVPRFESLRYSKVNGRIGPSGDHQIVWEYERAGLPVLVIKETRDIILRRKPQTGSIGRAKLQAGVLAELEGCEERWCEVRAGDYRGWVDKPSLWGLNTETAGL